MQRQSFSRRLIDGATMFVVTGLSLLLLVYVGFGEAKRTYEQFDLDKLIAQGSIAQSSIENYLRAGLPLKQFVGFTNLAEPIVENEDIDALAVYDLSGRQLFFVTDKSKPKLPEPPAIIKQVKDKIEMVSTGSHYQVVLPLRTRFETVGSVVIVSPKSVVTKRLNDTFRPLVILLLGLSVGFAVFVSLAAPYLARTRTPWLQVAYGVTFLAMAAFVIGSLISLYSDGVQGKAKETAFTLSQRLSDVVEFNLRIRDFESLDKMFAEYRRLNPEIKEAALIVDDAILVDTDSSKLGKAWVSDRKSYEYTVDLSRPGQERKVHVAVSVPGELVYHEVERSVRNFAALFVASCFFAGLFLQVAAAMQRLRQDPLAAGTVAVRVREESALAVVKPIFFLAVFIESLTYSFLPRFMQDIAASAGVSSGFASAPFTTYYLCFALSLIPAGHFSERRGPRALIWSGLLLAGTSMLSLTMPLGIIAATLARGVSGIGQGMLFIGIQAYILAVASPEKKTQGAAIIVFGFQGGMISGMAIGSLLVSYLQPQGVFAIGAAVGLATALYSAVLMPRGSAPGHAEAGFGAALTRVGGDMLRVMRSTEFLKTMFLIGVPAKAILTGIITFALPLLLGQEGYRQEEIGQVIMLYALAVVASSSLISRLVDRTGKTASMLFWGAVISGFGLVLIGFMGSVAIGHGGLSTTLVVIGVVLVGGAHGFINAPVVTHIAHSELAKQIGANPATATYRFLERLGHVAGPIMVAQLFLIWGQTAQIVAWMGVATMILGIFFILRRSRPHGKTRAAEDFAEIGTMEPRRLGLPQAMAAVLLLTLFAAPAQAESKPAYTKWFRYGASIEAAWEVHAVPDKPLEVFVRRKDAEKRGAARRVLVLYPRPSSAYDIAITTILDVFETKEINAEVMAVNFETDDQEGKDALKLAQDGRYDLILAMGSESTAWLYDHYRGGAIPVVSVCSKDPVLLGQSADYDHGSKTNFAFTSLNMPTDVQLAYVLELKPELKNFAVLVDSKNVSAVQTQAEPIAALAKRRGIQVIWGAVQNPATAREELATIVHDAVRTMRKNDPDLSRSMFWVTGSTSVFREMRTINENADRVPVVSVVPEVVKAGDDTAVLAIGISFESNAHLAAIYAANILDGRAKAGDLKVGVVSPPDIAISFRKAREIGLRVPFNFFESASFIYDYDGRPVRTTANKAPADN